MFRVVLFLNIVGFGVLANADVCSAPQKTQDVVACLKRQSPEAKKLEADDVEAGGLLRSSTQWANPILEFENTEGKSIDGTAGESRVRLSQSIEIGGKRSARRALGQSQMEALRASNRIGQDRVHIESILKLVRYRQVLTEIAVLEEALTTYEKVDRQFRSRPKLSPDQQVNAGIFNLALGDSRHKLAKRMAIKRQFETYFKTIPDFDLTKAKPYLPKRLRKWPSTDEKKLDITQSPQFKIVETEFKRSEAEWALARSHAWPDPTLSLIASNNVNGAYEYKSYGFAISFPLPVLNLNGGEKMQAAAAKTRAEIDSRVSMQSLESEKLNLLENYKSFVLALERAPDLKETEKTHQVTESLFYQGVIAGSLVIEAHRQILEFTESQNELEIETLDSLFQIYALDGSLKDFIYE